MKNNINDLTFQGMKKALDMVEIKSPGTDDPLVVDPAAALTFAAWGDPQISSVSPLRSARLAAACEDLSNAEGTLDALVLLGDITEFGRKCEYDMAGDIIGGASEKFRNFLCVSGNHDVRMRPHKKQLAKFENFVLGVRGGRVSGSGKYWFSYDINGYKMIMMGTDFTAFEGTFLSKAQLEWLDKELSSCEKGNPVFIFNHQTLQKTNGLPVTWLGKGAWRGSVGWQNDKLADILSKYKNVYYITGHLHYGVSRYNFEDCGNFKALSVPTVGVVNHGDFSSDSQGYVVSVYDDKVVIRARLFGDGKWVDSTLPGAYIEVPVEK
ncbi:MAG: metallophosphoesterase [Clostridia bacterium]|nr:metallophosphoesterase [Clostridia bacterium]